MKGHRGPVRFFKNLGRLCLQLTEINFSNSTGVYNCCRLSAFNTTAENTHCTPKEKNN